MKFTVGLIILAIIVLVALHCAIPKRNIIRFVCCLGISIPCCITGTMHGIFFGIILLSLEIIWNTCSKVINKYDNDIK
ncbi:hypothetical protein [Candidatus Avelusimicrobium luingense]|uniref:hypothetical protein n=1 Tax=Candidatus Avelusimicrobium luingense TaxID=3416211 RepID=UPI003D1407B0